MVWLQFAISAVIILIAGMSLTINADRLSDTLGLGKVWIGAIVLGLVTSLPEAGSSLYAVMLLGADDLAVGNVAGSNNFNLFLFVFLDLVFRQGSVTDLIQYKRAHFLSAMFALALAGIVAVEIAISRFMPLPNILGVSPGSILLAGLYLWGMRQVYLSNPAEGAVDEECRGEHSLAGIYAALALSMAGVIIGAVWLARSADIIAQSTGLGRTFVGSLFLAAATSFPELVVTISALRMGQIDLAVGNIFGSNMVNMFLLSVCDGFARGRVLLNHVAAAHIFTIIIGFVLTAIVLQGLKQTRKKIFFRMGWDSWALICVYCLGIAGLYLMR